MSFDTAGRHPETQANFALMETKPDAMERYVRLAEETSQYQKRLVALGVLTHTSWVDVDGAWHFKKFTVPRITPEHRDKRLLDRWDAWEAEFQQVEACSPKWRLKRMISALSVSHIRLSWPDRWERDVWQWAMAQGGHVPCPFEDRDGILDEDFRARMRELIAACDGFLYRCEESSQIVFASTEELPRIWAHQDHLAAIDREKAFGFFRDVSRPNWREYAREMTEVEQYMLSTIRRPKGFRSLLREMMRRLRNFR